MQEVVRVSDGYCPIGIDEHETRMPQFKQTQITQIMKPGPKPLNLTPEEKRRRETERKKNYRAKKKLAKEEYLKTPEGQAAER